MPNTIRIPFAGGVLPSGVKAYAQHKNYGSGGHDMNYSQGTNDQYRYYRCAVSVLAGGNGVAAVFLYAKK